MKMLTVKDTYTNFIGAYPVDSRSEINVRNSLKFFMRDRKIKLLCGDNAEEFEKAANILEIPFDNSVPKQTTAVVERTNLSEGKRVDATPCTPVFDSGERLAKDLYQRGLHSRKDVLNALRLANLKT